MASKPKKLGLRLELDRFTTNPAESNAMDPTSPKILKPKDYFEESDIHQDIELHLIVPEPHSKVIKIKTKTGDTIQNIKKVLEDNHDIPYGAQTLLLEGKPMLDPLSLNDFPLIARMIKDNPSAPHTVEVTVKVCPSSMEPPDLLAAKILMNVSRYWLYY